MRTLRNAILAIVLPNVPPEMGGLKIPVGIATAAKDKTPSFRRLHKTCLQPVSQPTVCNVCDEGPLDETDLLRGFEISKNNYIVIEEDEWESIKPERSETILIHKFVPQATIAHPIYISNGYWITPKDSESMLIGYQLIWGAMGEMALAGIGTCALWGKEMPCTVIADPSGMIYLSRLFSADEVEFEDRPPLEMPKEARLKAQELLRGLVGEVDEEDLSSGSRRRTEALLAAKLKDVAVVAVEEVPALVPSTNFLEDLKASIDAMQTTKKPAKKPTKKAVK